MVYVDPIREVPADRLPDRIQRFGYLWCRLTADTATELHRFARKLGLRRSDLQRPGTTLQHYELVPAKRKLAVSLGAQEITRTEMARRTRGQKLIELAESAPSHEDRALLLF